MPNGNGWRWNPLARQSGSWLLRLVVLIALVAAGVWAYRANVTTSGPAMDMTMRVNAGDTPFPVTLAPVTSGAMIGTVTYTGSVAPFNEEDIFPRVTGRIVEMPVYPGDAVQAGQVVARLDDVELASRVREAEAMAATAQANGAQMEADVVAARQGVVQMERELAMVDAELSYARGVRDRSERLVASGAISRQDYENDRSMAQALEAKREAAQAKLEQARAMETSSAKKLEAAQAMIAQGRAASRTAQIVRDYVSIVAPTGGYVAKRLVAPGVLVQPGMPILKIAELDRVRLQANVGEKDIGTIRIGSPVTVTTTDGQTLSARVTAVFPFVDQGPRTAVVEAIVDNQHRRLLPGQYVTMEIATGERADAITVPRGAIARLGEAAKVWVVIDGRAEPRSVTTGLASAERVEIVRGLSVGERVVARGHEGLFAGARVVDTAAGAKPPETPAKPSEQQPMPMEGGHGGH
jgi:multidrug efflux pump subunit AcrA (membrane-fusion protein)